FKGQGAQPRFGHSLARWGLALKVGIGWRKHQRFSPAATLSARVNALHWRQGSVSTRLSKSRLFLTALFSSSPSRKRGSRATNATVTLDSRLRGNDGSGGGVTAERASRHFPFCWRMRRLSSRWASGV